MPGQVGEEAKQRNASKEAKTLAELERGAAGDRRGRAAAPPRGSVDCFPERFIKDWLCGDVAG